MLTPNRGRSVSLNARGARRGADRLGLLIAALGGAAVVVLERQWSCVDALTVSMARGVEAFGDERRTYQCVSDPSGRRCVTP